MTDTLPRAATAAPRRARRRATPLAGALALLVAVAGCGGRDDSGSGTPQATGPAAVTVTGPLCDVLPSGTEPGNPASLVGQPADRALGWIPVLTTFEAAVRASGMATELTGSRGVTILAPTDDAFAAKFSRTDLDEMLLKDTGKLRGLLREHVVTGALPVAEMVSAGTVTTLAGTRLTVTAKGSGARVDDEADLLCADYRAVEARIHVIDHVLGSLPTTANDDDHPAH